MGTPERRRARLIRERVGVSGTTANNWLRGDTYLITCDNPAIATETIERLGSHLNDSAKAREVLVLGRVALAFQKL
jgi:hypothetical protein